MNQKAKLNNALVRILSQKNVPALTVLHNMNGSSERSPKCPNCKSWINHWANLSEQPVPDDGDCATVGCSGCGEDGQKLPMEGCHVKIVGSSGSDVYIAPLCKACNAKHGMRLVLKRGVVLVRANVAKTCAKLETE